MQLFEQLSSHDIYSWMLLNRSADPRGILLLESGYDCQVYEAHMSEDVMTSLACGGKQRVLEVMSIAQEQAFRKVCAAVDADVDAFVGGRLPASVYATDYNDLEACAFFSEEGGRVFVGPLLPPGRYTSEEIEEAIDETVSLAFAVGRLRLKSVRDGVDLSLAGLPFGRVVATTSRKVLDLSLLASIIVSRSTRESMCARCIERHLTDYVSTATPMRELRLCNGHDLSQLLAIRITSMGGPSLSGHTVELLLKAVLHKCRVFRGLTIHADLEKWGLNEGFTFWHSECTAA